MKKNPDIINWYENNEVKQYITDRDNPNKEYHNLSIPFMGVISGSTGAGKTQFVCSLLKAFSDKRLNKNKKGTFASVDYFTQNKNEPLLKWLASKSNQINIYENLDKLDIDSKDKDLNHLVIFDDMVVQKNQQPIVNAFIRARKQGCSCLYLTQDFFKCPPIIRKQSHYLFILKFANKREMDLVLRDYAISLNANQLRHMYHYATQDKFCPLTIDTTTVNNAQKFRKGLLEYLNPADFI